MNIPHILVYINIYAVLAISLNLVVGYCGLMSLTHAGFYALGAYAYALLTIKAGWGFLPACAGAAIISSAASLLVSLSSWRLKGDFFVMASLAVQAALLSLLNNWSNSKYPLGSWQNLTNGPNGISRIPAPTILGISTKGQVPYAIFSGVVAFACLILVWRLVKCPWGRMLTTMRDDELAARGIGKNTRMARVQAFAISAALAAVAGTLYAGHVKFVDPTMAGLDESILMLSMIIAGGLGNLRGAVAGGILVIVLPEALRFFHYPDAQASVLKVLILGLGLILLMHFRPQGLLGSYRME